MLDRILVVLYLFSVGLVSALKKCEYRVDIELQNNKTCSNEFIVFETKSASLLSCITLNEKEESSSYVSYNEESKICRSCYPDDDGNFTSSEGFILYTFEQCHYRIFHNFANALGELVFVLEVPVDYQTAVTKCDVYGQLLRIDTHEKSDPLGTYLLENGHGGVSSGYWIATDGYPACFKLGKFGNANDVMWASSSCEGPYNYICQVGAVSEN